MIYLQNNMNDTHELNIQITDICFECPCIITRKILKVYNVAVDIIGGP